ncbi:RNA-directed DNA polymerase, eukaryota, reverse transcriptase zinc-binding domain protein [Tanacetum coccineum]|uniref:RNA-directed DNA polymerase, eukaryota, reverse transcriptase zinc-binding domain protein n=1 Tax=Tanacetum coccineum TaxID=301880 RepID=A0ABQ5H1R9_9ASTR
MENGAYMFYGYSMNNALGHTIPVYLGDLIGSGYHQKDRKPSQNDKTEHGMEKTVQNQGQSPKMPKSESILKNTIECNLYPSDGPGKPNISKLKLLKKPLRKLKFAQGDLAKKVVESRHELERVQAMMVDDSHNFVLWNKEFECLKVYKDAMRDEESMLKQRAKVSWLSEGDTNTKFFHKTVKGKLNRNRIENVEDMDGLMFSGQHVGDHFMNNFHSDLSKLGENKSVFFAMNDDKAPRTDGFSSKFFKASWSVIGDEVCTAIGDFLKNGHLLKEVNATIIVLMPKSQTPQKVSNIRPISCCNVLYKAITMIIADKIKGFLGMLVDESQNAFILSRQISDNVLLTQELMRNYHRNRGPSKVAFKIDIHKAYDSVEWDFMKQCLIHFGFHKKMIDWVMNCLSSPSFSINVNGYSHGFFKGMRGLRQGDPLSPYLFTLVMEVFSLMVKRKIEDDGGFKYHWRCDRLKLTHLSFADDLMVFSRADVHSVTILSKALMEFSGVSGLVPNLDKSSVFFGNVSEHVKVAILNVLPFAVGNLPVRYLGLPLLSSRLFKHHCGGLIDNVKKRLINWKNKALSFAGRLQLIKSVVSSIQVYWASTFILPKAVNAEIEQLMRGFLWSHGELRRGHAKVKWKDVCSMKNQGGLGIKSLNIWNISLIAKHIWNVVSKKDSLWVKWVNAYRLIDRSSNVRNFWDIPVLNDSSWGWRKLLQCRDVLREHFVCRIGDGSQTSVWYDNWLSLGPLSKFISNRMIYEAGFSLDCKDRRDRVLWRSNDGNVGNFSVSAVWSDLSESKPKVPWTGLRFGKDIMILSVLFVGFMTISSLIAVFLEIWHQFRDLVKLDSAPNALSILIPYIAGRPINRSIWIILQRLVIGALVYIVWQERNLRRFQMKCRSVKDFCMIIKDVMRFRLLSLKIRSSRQVTEAAELWNLGVEDGNEGRKFGFCMNG